MAVFLAGELEAVATYWRVYRSDGVALGFTSHDRDLSFGNMRHRAAPGMLPSAIRRTSDLSLDSAEVEGALSHDAIDENDLAVGLFDGARIVFGAVNWETLEHEPLYSGTLGEVRRGEGGFSADLRSAKTLLEKDLVPRTSPTCRAEFCGPQCGLSAARFTRRSTVEAIDADRNTVSVSGIGGPDFLDGQLRLLGGPQTGMTFGIVHAAGPELVLDRPIASANLPGTGVIVREGCDHTFATCAGRFANAVNFRGEPFLPGNDLLARYAAA